MSDLKKQAFEAFDLIVKDMCGRSGGDWWYEPIDPETKEEIKETWTQIMVKAFET